MLLVHLNSYIHIRKIGLFFIEFNRSCQPKSTTVSSSIQIHYDLYVVECFQLIMDIFQIIFSHTTIVIEGVAGIFGDRYGQNQYIVLKLFVIFGFVISLFG